MAYKIMFVDDDLLILRRLHQILDWKNLGFDLLPDAANGNIALDLIRNSIPDVIICDINMPGMNGLELIEKLKALYPSIQCILLTVNDSFGCVQRALNIGVNNYLLKPIDPIKLEKIITRILEILNSSREHENYVNTLYNKALLNERMIRDKFLNWLVSGRQMLNEKQILEKFTFYRIPVCGEEFQMIAIHINNSGFWYRAESVANELMQTISKSIEDTLNEFPNCVVFTDPFCQFNILIGHSSKTTPLEPSIEYLCKLLKDSLLFNLNLSVTVFFSRKYSGANNIYRCYYDTKFLSQYTSYVVDKGIISFDEYLKHSFDFETDLDSVRTKTFRLLRAGDKIELFKHIENTLNIPIIRGAFDTFSMLRVDFVMTGLMYLQENRISLQDVFDPHFAPLADIVSLNIPEECSSFLNGYYVEIIDFIQTNKFSSGKYISDKCVELIEKNIASPRLSVKWLSEQIYINDNYLSRLFHKEMGIPLIKFITQKRMATAKNYLDNGCTNLGQVSSLVGFTDSLYFSKCFKKHYGISPSLYIRQML